MANYYMIWDHHDGESWLKFDCGVPVAFHIEQLGDGETELKFEYGGSVVFQVKS